jgi:WD40 repeat protein
VIWRSTKEKGVLAPGVRIWDLATLHELVRFTYNVPVFGVVFSPDGARLATAASYDTSARVWAI